MAHLTDERGNPIQLTDELGNPVTLTDEHGNLVHLSGVAYTTDNPVRGGPVVPGGVGPPTSGTTMGEVLRGEAPAEVPRRVDEVGATHTEIRRSSSSSSSSSDEELGEGELVEGEGSRGTRRRKKKGITQKLKEKLNLTKEKDAVETTTMTTAAAAPSAIPHIAPTTATYTAPTTATYTAPTTVSYTAPATVPQKIATIDTTTQKMTVEHVEKEKGGAFVASDTTTATVTTEHRDQNKKGVLEKLMEKLPGHHSSH